MSEEEDLEAFEPDDLPEELPEELSEPDFPEEDLPVAEELPDLAEGEVLEPDFDFEPEEVLLLLLSPEEDFEPVLEEEEPVSLPLLLPCIPPEDMEEVELPMPDWPDSDIAFEPEPELEPEPEPEPDPDIEDCPEFF